MLNNVLAARDAVFSAEEPLPCEGALEENAFAEEAGPDNLASSPVPMSVVTTNTYRGGSTVSAIRLQNQDL